jgi:hypothetical protein
MVGFRGVALWYQEFAHPARKDENSWFEHAVKKGKLSLAVALWLSTS